MRLQCEGLPDPAHRAAAQSALHRQRTRAPVRGVLRPGFQRHRQHPLYLGIADLARRAGTRFIQQTIQPLVDKTLPPLPHGLDSQMKFPGHLRVGVACRAQ